MAIQSAENLSNDNQALQNRNQIPLHLSISSKFLHFFSNHGYIIAKLLVEMQFRQHFCIKYVNLLHKSQISLDSQILLKIN